MSEPAQKSEPLAIEGGKPVCTSPMPTWPVLGNEEIDAVSEVLRSGKISYWTGSRGKDFEKQWSELTDCQYAVALANGTVALELALHALGIESGDEVVVTCRSFIASASCCTVRGITPIFADVDPNSQNITVDSIRPVLSTKTKAIIAVHMAGWPCDMDPILDLAKQHKLAVIEDCAQAHGATYNGRPVGSLGDAGAFSFCQDKIITTGGEGGMLTTNRKDVWKKAWSYKDHGKSWDAACADNPSCVFQWMHESSGTNWRMTEMQAAIGQVLARKLPCWTNARRENANLLNDQLEKIPTIRTTRRPKNVGHGYYKYYVFLRPERLRTDWTRDRIVKAIRAEGIPCGSGICPEIYLEKTFEGSKSLPVTRLPTARRLGETSLMLQVHPTLSKANILDTCQAIKKVLNVASSSP